MRALLALPVRALSSSLALLAERVLPHSVSRRVADCFYRVSDLPAIRGAFSRSAVRHFLGVPAYGGNAGARVAVTGVSVVQREESAESVLLPAHMNTQQENMAALPQPSVFAKPKSDQSTRLDDDRAKELPKDLQVSHALTVSTLAEVTRRKAKRQRKPLVYVKDDRENTDPKEETDPGAPEVIKKISPFVVWKDKSKDADRFDDEYQGYAIKTNKQTIRLLISRWGQCCEKFGGKEKEMWLILSEPQVFHD